MENEQLKEELKKIETFVADLQEPVKTITAKELVSKLLGTKQSSILEKGIIEIKKKKTQKSVSNKSASIKEDEEKDKAMINSIDRTQYAEIHKLKKNLDKALYILKIMKEKGYDGLNPPQITLILTDIFGIIANVPAISMSLINDKFYTKKSPMMSKGAKSFQYKIIQTGIDYVNRLLKELSKGKNNIHENQKEGAQEF